MMLVVNPTREQVRDYVAWAVREAVRTGDHGTAKSRAAIATVVWGKSTHNQAGQHERTS